jgi:sucrose phosphorylase
MVNHSTHRRIQKHLEALYGKDQTQDVFDRIIKRLEHYRVESHNTHSSPLDTLGEVDAILITYGDQFQKPGESNLISLANFVNQHLKDLITGVHILPFFPYSSDDGFSVIDYKEVDPELGSWQDIEPLRDCCILMFDAVINHISRESLWFQGFLKGLPPYDEYFISIDPDEDLSMVTRPRAKPLLTKVDTNTGPKHVWTTFSPDQIDLNYKNPDLLIDILEILLFYIQRGARIIRLDAIAYLWKEIGTKCIHLPQTHQIIKLIRAVLDEYAPHVVLITETNVPHEENISYFGQQLESSQGKQSLGDEAQMVYQFSLAPLILHAFQTGDATKLANWAESLHTPFSTATYLNFIASHDGIGVRPAEGILSTEEIKSLVDQVHLHGGQVSYKTNQDGSESVYELNITLYDALNNPKKTTESIGNQRFLASQAIMLSLSGVPGIYIHSLFGSSNDFNGIAETGRARSINRKKFSLHELESQLDDPASRASQIFSTYSHYLKVRKSHPAFHPLADQQIIALDPSVFALIRTSRDKQKVLCLINVTGKEVHLDLTPHLREKSKGKDLITGDTYQANVVNLGSYQVLWLVEE